jgi:hypothetical protein
MAIAEAVPARKRVVIVAIALGGSKFAVRCDDRLLIKSTRQPLLDGARVLLDQGIDPDTTVVLRHDGSSADSLTAKLGAAARLTVEETAHRPAFRSYRMASRGAVDAPPVRRKRRANVGQPKQNGAAPP